MKQLLPLFLILGQQRPFVSGWSYTQYWATVASSGWAGLSTHTGVTCPTGTPPRPTSTTTNTSTIELLLPNTISEFEEDKITVPITMTYFDLPANVSFTAGVTDYSVIVSDFACASDHVSSSITDTHFYAPAIISNPPSCTLTSFHYTTSYSVSLGDSQLISQAMGSSIAELITQVTSVISTDLGGQQVKSTYTAVFMSKEAFGPNGIQAAPNEEGYLSECVDPRRYLCSANPYSLTPSDIMASPGSCSITPVTYPPGSGSTGGSGSPAASTTRASSQKGEAFRQHIDLTLWGILLAIGLVTLVLL
ncbi:hypothetical protein F1880_002351 [Penicillium rolfsii]|nr:hypothetical protein F1880_002351 [Penicillium rolfsii]